MLDLVAFLACLEFAVLNSLYSETILKPKQVVCLESLYLQEGCYVRVTNGLREIIDFPFASNVVVCEDQVVWSFTLRLEIKWYWHTTG